MIEKKIFYISEANINSSSAYSIHVSKMCDAFKNIGYNVSLVFPNNMKLNKNYKKFYNLKNHINLIQIFHKIKKLNFITRIIFGIKVYNLVKKNRTSEKIISRSVLSSLILSFFNISNILEIHHEQKGFTGFIFSLSKNFKFFEKINFIFIHKNLISKIDLPKKNKYIILDDAVDLNNFKIKSKEKKNLTSCIYIGSFYQGKGIEIINEICKKYSGITFHLYGDKSFLKKKFLHKNIKVFDFVEYNEIPKLLLNYEFAIMPYQKKVFARSSNLNIESTMSPLKMFDYLAGKKIIFASKLKVYSHILKNNFNSILINPEKTSEWIKAFEVLKNKKNLRKKLKKNAYETAKKFTWNKRVEIINSNFLK